MWLSIKLTRLPTFFTYSRILNPLMVGSLLPLPFFSLSPPRGQRRHVSCCNSNNADISVRLGHGEDGLTSIYRQPILNTFPNPSPACARSRLRLSAFSSTRMARTWAALAPRARVTTDAYFIPIAFCIFASLCRASLALFSLRTFSLYHGTLACTALGMVLSLHSLLSCLFSFSSNSHSSLHGLKLHHCSIFLFIHACVLPPPVSFAFF